ncbi:UDP-glucose 4-epimerase GalE [Streptomyces parvulus]|uniref:UDP-glucose 4-epimerase GalE n=1 Tax=Streptomyces parvulus TaxID=146923 RepID=UPI00383032DA
MKVLITGGAGYIGSTVAFALSDEGIDSVILDDLSTGRPEFLHDRPFYEGDVADGALIDQIFTEHPDISVTLHCAAKVGVPEAMSHPLDFYRENVGKTIDLLIALQRNGCERVVFSSSAVIYAAGAGVCVDESAPVKPTSPYPRTKRMVEQVLEDWTASAPVRAISLRYFSPLGADPKLRSGLQSPNSPYVLSRLIEAHVSDTPFTITGIDWPTRDGSAIRDFIHVWDVARAHVAALLSFDSVVAPSADRRYQVINIGAGEGTTIRELVSIFENVIAAKLEVREAGPKSGDVVGCYASRTKARDLLGWSPEMSIAEAVRDGLAWRKQWAHQTAEKHAC